MDDYRDTILGDGPLGVLIPNASHVYGGMDFLGDQDVFQTDLVLGKQYSIFLDLDPFSNLYGRGLRLYDESGVQLAPRIYDGGAYLNFTPSYTGTYFLIASTSIEYTGQYELSVFDEPAGGSETVSGTEQADEIDGAEGDDVIRGYGGADSLSGGTGDDVLYGGSGDDDLENGLGTDVCYGGAGDDHFFAQDDGENYLFGDDGDDRFVIATWGFDDRGTLETKNTIDGGAGVDTVELYFLEQYAVLNPRIDLVAQTITFAGDMWPIQTIISIENVVGSDNSDVILGTDEVNEIFGYEGRDEIFGGSGEDQLHAGGGYDVIYGGAGDDYVDGGGDIYSIGNDNDVLFGDGGDDQIVGNDYDDILYGGTGDDDLTGDHAYIGDDPFGDDTLYGGQGADRLSGGKGNDILNGGTETDFFNGGAGSDTALFTGLTTDTRIDLAIGVASLPGTTSIRETLVSIENVEAGTGDDVLIGNAASNRLLGNLGNDTVTGGAGDDALYGGDGDDTFDGGGGADQMFGGTGADILLGGLGIDRMDGGEGVDTVATSSSAAARIDLGLGQLRFLGTPGTETLISMENATSGAGADVLVGGAGANVLRGGDGADRLRGGGEADTLIGGAGSDTFEFLSAADSRAGLSDRLQSGDGVAAFQGVGAPAGDLIDLSAIDANTSATGDQSFQFGTAKGAARLWLVEVGADTHLRANVDADAAYEFELIIADGAARASAYHQSDFGL